MKQKFGLLVVGLAAVAIIATLISYRGGLSGFLKSQALTVSFAEGACYDLRNDNHCQVTTEAKCKELHGYSKGLGTGGIIPGYVFAAGKKCPRAVFFTAKESCSYTGEDCSLYKPKVPRNIADCYEKVDRKVRSKCNENELVVPYIGPKNLGEWFDDSSDPVKCGVDVAQIVFCVPESDFVSSIDPTPTPTSTPPATYTGPTSTPTDGPAKF